MYILDWIMVPIQIIIFLFTVYYFLIGVNGLWRKKEKKILTPQKTFAVIVAAHNESAVIGQLVDNLKMLDYPKELYDIFVIADNCTDNTAPVSYTHLDVYKRQVSLSPIFNSSTATASFSLMIGITPMDNKAIKALREFIY